MTTFPAPRAEQLDHLTAKWTAFASFHELVTWHDTLYRPTLRGELGWQYIVLADAYDAAQAERGDPRRAYRG